MMLSFEQIHRISDFLQLVGFVDEVHQRVNTLGEVIRGGNFNVGSGGGFSCKVSSGFKVAVAGGRLHAISNQYMVVAIDEVLFLKAQICVTSCLVQQCHF